MSLNFFFDQPDIRASLAEFVSQRSANARMLTGRGLDSWNGRLPDRVGDYFYKEPWILCSEPVDNLRDIDLSVFADTGIISLEQAASELVKLVHLVDWAIFPWGGNAGYGMLRQLTRDSASTLDPQLRDPRFFEYPTVQDFRESYHGVIGRRTRSEFAPALWHSIRADTTDLFVITFEYYADAFCHSNVEFSVEGTITDTVASNLSVYRIRDFAAFKYFVGLINTVEVFEILPSNLSLDSCQEIRRLTSSQNLAGALEHTPWFLVCNEGEIDTYPVLFVSSEHRRLLRFVNGTGDSLEFASYF